MRLIPAFVLLAFASLAMATPSPVHACPQFCIECDDGTTLCACAAQKGCPAK
ncbi:hypothetical protein EXIGLDRAFT_718377 [Exidia glandulosa HHB12029]|uniref:Extracellular membrane protein CFEM domain-containing protein n=1 Tax=Exidia glandulosa HHB12029 TaxID=1314781 RepID=A0A166AJ72_EXIGL|nr:hypothetical protein EXIGLDRAFT_718377 [Exidia glandulosa HHB12029]